MSPLVSCKSSKHKRTRGRNALPDVNPPASRTLFAGKGHVQGGGSVVRAVGMEVDMREAVPTVNGRIGADAFRRFSSVRDSQQDRSKHLLDENKKRTYT